MPSTIQHSETKQHGSSQVRPSTSAVGKPFTLDQELTKFGHWADDPIWVPPKDSNETMAQTMFKHHESLAPKKERWASVVEEHRADFTQVREIELDHASIRLPKGKFFVTVTEQDNFDSITDDIPACVQTRLDEFLAGPGQQPGVRVTYLKPLCIEVGSNLLLTPREDLMAAIDEIKEEVFAEYQRLYLNRLPRRVANTILNVLTAIPRGIVNFYLNRRKRAIDMHERRLEFQRRKTVLRATKAHQKCFTTGCTFNEMLALTVPLPREEVIKDFANKNGLSKLERDSLIAVAVGTLPWFATLSLAVAYTGAVAAAVAAPVAPVAVCDPVFVAEFPTAPGVLMKIGHFDVVDGVTHVEL